MSSDLAFMVGLAVGVRAACVSELAFSKQREHLGQTDGRGQDFVVDGQLR
ncbi:hypothetical protein [Plantactinospora sp. WMMB782]